MTVDGRESYCQKLPCVLFWDKFFGKNNLLGKALKPSFFAVVSSDLKHLFSMKKNNKNKQNKKTKNGNTDCSSSISYLIDVN